MSSISVVNDIKITTDENGNQHFEVIEEPKKEVVDNRSWWQKLKDWYNNSQVKLYAKVRDLADPFGDRDDFDVGSDGVSGAEVGIKISF